MSCIILKCPTDGLKLKDRGEEFQCQNGCVWKIVNSIPRFVKGKGNYAASFGVQWQVWRKTQLDSYTGTRISYDRVRRCLGEELWRQLSSSSPCNVLEAGCGAGRFTEVLTTTPLTRVFSVDTTSAVDANQDNCPQDDLHRIFQADINRLPFAPRQFCLVVCLGVIQHTPCPEETIAALYDQVKPGGALVLDHYTFSIRRLTKIGQLLRPLFKRMPSEKRLKYIRRLVDIFFPLHRAVSRVWLFQIILSRVSPIVTYYHAYPELNDRLQYEWSLLDTHDTLTDWYKHLRSYKQIELILKNLGAVDIKVARGGNGIEARCRRP